MSSAQLDDPAYAPFFGSMGAASAIIFSGCSGSRVRDGEERHGDRCDVGVAARADYEIHHPRCHGGYHRHLRASRSRPHRWHSGTRLHRLQGNGAPGSGAGGRLQRAGCGARHRHRRRLRGPRHGAAASPLRRHDSHTHLR